MCSFILPILSSVEPSHLYPINPSINSAHPISIVTAIIAAFIVPIQSTIQSAFKCTNCYSSGSTHSITILTAIVVASIDSQRSADEPPVNRSIVTAFKPTFASTIL